MAKGSKDRTGSRRCGRIAMVAYTHYDTDPRCRREATLAASAGWEVDFFALSHDGTKRSTRVEGVNLHEMGMSRYRGSNSSTYVLSYLRFLALAGARVQGQHLRRRFDVVHVNTMPDFMVMSALLPRVGGARVILDIHDVMPEIYMSKFGLSASHWKIRLIKSIEVLSSRVSHHVLTAEHPKAELLVRHGIPADKVSVLLNLPDDVIFRPKFNLTDPALAAPASDPSSEFRLIYHGTLAHRLGMDNAIEALARVSEAIPGVRLQLFGDGDQLPELRAQATELGLSDRIWFSGRFVAIESIVPAIDQAHLAVIPTRHDASTDYMLPTKLLEYLAFGIPAIFTPTLTVKHYFGDRHPLYLEDPSPQAIADKILWVRQHYDEVKRLTAELQDEWFSRYHWPDHKLSYLRLLEDLLAPTHR